MKLRSFVLASGLLLGAVGCSDSDSKDKTREGPDAGGASGAGGADNTGDEVLQLFSWWKDPGGEAEALGALRDIYTADYDGARIAQAATPTAATWQEELAERIDDSPWDVVQLSASDLTSFREKHPGSLAELDDIYAEAGLDDAMLPEIREVVTRGGQPFGVVTGIHRNNAFLYNKQRFDELGLEPPTTVSEFLEVSEQFLDAGIVPVASDLDTWVLRILFDELLAGTMGARGFDDFIKGNVKATDADVQAHIESAIDTFDTVLTKYVDVERAAETDYNWTSAAQDLYDGKAAMLFHGDWAKGYLVYLGWTPGVDFGVLGPPGASELFVYGADMFCLPSTAPNPDLARNFLSVVASPKGQVAFNSYKGATPMRTDVRDQLDEPGQLSLDGLINAEVLMPGHANDGWDKGIEAFALDHDKAALLEVYLTTEP